MECALLDLAKERVSETCLDRDVTSMAEVTSERERSDLLRRAEVAEAIAEERGNALEDVRTAMRMLQAGTTAKADTVADLDETTDVLDLTDPPTEDTDKATEPAPVAKARRRFLARFSR